jgi:hypothetical protein
MVKAVSLGAKKNRLGDSRNGTDLVNRRTGQQSMVAQQRLELNAALRKASRRMAASALCKTRLVSQKVSEPIHRIVGPGPRINKQLQRPVARAALECDLQKRTVGP